jgi:hypothetical protein
LGPEALVKASITTTTTTFTTPTTTPTGATTGESNNNAETMNILMYAGIGGGAGLVAGAILGLLMPRRRRAGTGKKTCDVELTSPFDRQPSTMDGTAMGMTMMNNGSIVGNTQMATAYGVATMGGAPYLVDGGMAGGVSNANTIGFANGQTGYAMGQSSMAYGDATGAYGNGATLYTSGSGGAAYTNVSGGNGYTTTSHSSGDNSGTGAALLSERPTYGTLNHNIQQTDIDSAWKSMPRGLPNEVSSLPYGAAFNPNAAVPLPPMPDFAAYNMTMTRQQPAIVDPMMNDAAGMMGMTTLHRQQQMVMSNMSPQQGMMTGMAGNTMQQGTMTATTNGTATDTTANTLTSMQQRNQGGSGNGGEGDDY